MRSLQTESTYASAKKTKFAVLSSLSAQTGFPAAFSCRHSGQMVARIENESQIRIANDRAATLIHMLNITRSRIYHKKEQQKPEAIKTKTQLMIPILRASLLGYLLTKQTNRCTSNLNQCECRFPQLINSNSPGNFAHRIVHGSHVQSNSMQCINTSSHRPRHHVIAACFVPTCYKVSSS
jgi:hypothetical protein